MFVVYIYLVCVVSVVDDAGDKEWSVWSQPFTALPGLDCLCQDSLRKLENKNWILRNQLNFVVCFLIIQWQRKCLILLLRTNFSILYTRFLERVM